MKKSSVSRMQRFAYSQILCYASEIWIRTQHRTLFGNDSWIGSKIHHTTEHWTQSTENWWNSSGIFSQDSPHWSSSVKSKSSWAKWANPNNAKDDLSSCRCSMTSFGEIKTMKRNLLLIPHLWLYSQKDFQQDVGHSSDLGQKQSGSSLTRKEQEEKWDRVAELMMIKFGESGHPVFRAKSPFSGGTLKSKGGGKLSIHFCADGDTIETFSRNYFCQPAQYLRSSLIIVWRIRNPSLQFADSVACREYTLPRDEDSSEPKRWIRGNTKIGPVLEVTSCYLQGKHGVEIWIASVNNDNSHSWVRISHGLNNLVTDLIDREYDDDEQETSTTNTEVFSFAGRSKAKAKPRRPSTTCSSSRTPYLFLTEYGFFWTRNSDRSSLPSGKKIKHSSSARRITSRRRWSDRILEIERWSSGQFLSILNIGLMMYGRERWQEAEATIKDFNTVLTRQDKKFFTFELLKVIQDAISLILHCRTMSWFRTISSSTFNILDVQSICIPSRIQDW